MVARVLGVTLFILLGISLIGQGVLEVSHARGTGRTTGHIADLTVENNSDKPITIAPARYYIPSHHRYQSYVGDVPGGITVPPGGTVVVPVSGYCADIHKPPVPSGEDMPPFDTWIGVGGPSTFPGQVYDPPVSPSGEPLTPDNVAPPFRPGDIPDIISSPGFTPAEPGDDPDIIVTFPGTDTPIGGTIDPNTDPVALAPVLTGILDVIEQAAPVIQETGDYPNPFTPDPVREREAMIQQTFWIATGELGDDSYDKGDFAGQVYEQFENSSGIVVEDLPAEQRESLDHGVDAFWQSFTAVGLEAKVFNEEDDDDPVPEVEILGPGDETIVPPAEKDDDSGCVLEIRIRDSGYRLDYDIANTGTRETNEEVEEAFRAAIEQAAGIVSDAEGSDSVDVAFTSPEMPASAWSLWFPHAIAGRANAQAMHVNPEDLLASAWTTEPLQTEVEGDFTVVLTHITEECESTLIGINMAIVRANSSIDAQVRHVEVLRVLNWVGEVAIDFLLTRGRGTSAKLSKYLKEKFKDLAKEQLKEAMAEEIERLAREMTGNTEEEVEQTLDELIEEIRNERDEGPQEEEPQDDEEFLAEFIAELIVEGEPPSPPNPAEEFKDAVDSPVDWSPIKTNTYAIAEGQLDIWVDDMHGLAKAGSGARYKREGLEDEEETVAGGGVVCSKAMKSKITSGQITLKTEGEVATDCAATGEGIISTGHGAASATLESFNGHYVIALCECPDGNFYDKYMSATTLTQDDLMGTIWTSVFENLMDEVSTELDEQIANLPQGRAVLPNDTAENIKIRMEEQAARAARSILNCPED